MKPLDDRQPQEHLEQDAADEPQPQQPQRKWVKPHLYHIKRSMIQNGEFLGDMEDQSIATYFPDS